MTTGAQDRAAEAEVGTLPPLKAPFPYFGGKSRVAAEVWRRFGNPKSYVEPFAGSLAVLLRRPDPDPSHVETVNDADGLLANFWRALQADPAVVAYYADWPANEADLHARHLWLQARRPRLTEHLMGDPHYYDPKAAGWWVWGLSLWVGSGWCAGSGPWISRDGELVKGNPGQGVHRQTLHLGNPGRGVHRQTLHLGSPGQGVHRKTLHLGDPGRGVHRQTLHLGDPGHGGLVAELARLAARLRRVRVNCGDWTRVTAASILQPSRGCAAAVFLDPPYGEAHDRGIFGKDTAGLAAAVRDWAIAHQDVPGLRLALCSYGADHLPAGWTRYAWQAQGGYANLGQGRGRANKARETIWFSPQCLDPAVADQATP
jgi:hypothetical protein